MQPMDERFLALIHSYLPDWQIGQEEPEAAVLYAAWRLLENTRGRIERLPAKHEREFLNAWPMEAREAEPMSVYAAFQAPEGEHIPAGREMYLSGNGTRLWRTTQPVCAESMTLMEQILESAGQGKLIEVSPPSPEIPSRLFDFGRDGQQRYAARFAHPDAFRSEKGCQVFLDFPECDSAFLDHLADPEKVFWMWEQADGSTQELRFPRREEKTLEFEMPAAPSAVALLAEVCPGTVPPSQIVGRVLVSSRRPAQPYQVAISSEETTAEGTFFPFDLNPEPWRSCCLACPDVLSLRGAEVELTCRVMTTQREEKLPGMDEEPQYRSIMLRMPPKPLPVRDIFPQSVVWEYWNGRAWLPIPDTKQLRTVFGKSDEMHTLKAKFRWPEDAQPCQVQGQDGCWLRWRIARVEGVGYLPSRTYIPKICDLCMSAVLEQAPVELSAYRGLNPIRFPVEQTWNSRLFLPPDGEEDGWWLRFDHGPKEDRLNLFLEFSERISGTSLSAWESTARGMEELGLEDDTDGLSHSGLMCLSNIRGQKTERFGHIGWWICIRDHGGNLSRGSVYPKLMGLYPGTVCLRAEGGDQCKAGEPVKPLRGGALIGQTLTDSFGGAPAESEEELLIRAEKYRHHMGRGVSPLDIEQLVQFSFRDVVRTRSRRKGNQVFVAVLMRDIDQHSAAFAQRREPITRLLREKTVIPTLGLRPLVREPNFYPIQTTIWMETGRDGDFQMDKERICQLLKQFFNPVTGKFRGDGWRIGYLPTYQELDNYIMMQLPEITLVKVLMTAITPEGREVSCSDLRDPFALPVAGKTVVHEVRGEDMR